MSRILIYLRLTGLCVVGVALTTFGYFLWISIHEPILNPAEQSSTSAGDDGVLIDNYINPPVNSHALVNTCSAVLVLLLGICIIGWAVVILMKSTGKPS